MIDRFEILNKDILAGLLIGWEGGWDGHYVCISIVNRPLKLSLTDDLCYLNDWTTIQSMVSQVT